MAETEVQANNIKTPPAKSPATTDAPADAMQDIRAEAIEMKARAAAMLKRGTISEAEYDKIVAKADALLGQAVAPATEVRAVDNDD